ncbi:MAG TPA: NAD-binding protein [Acidimicrobiales bacterium]
MQAKRANIETGHYPPSFKLSLAAKDMSLAVDTAEHAGVGLKTAERVRRWLGEAADQGAVDLHVSAVVTTILGEPDHA